MDVTLATIADYATVDKAEKLSIIGIFDKILSATVPVHQRSLFLVLVFQSTRGDYNRPRDIRIEITDLDGRLIGEPIEGNVAINGSPDIPPAVNMIVNINDLRFPRFGPYTFTIFVAGDAKRTLRLDVLQTAQLTPE